MLARVARAQRTVDYLRWGNLSLFAFQFRVAHTDRPAGFGSLPVPTKWVQASTPALAFALRPGKSGFFNGLLFSMIYFLFVLIYLPGPISRSSRICLLLPSLFRFRRLID